MNKVESILNVVDAVVARAWVKLSDKLTHATVSDVMKTVHDAIEEIVNGIHDDMVGLAWWSWDESIKALADGLTLVQTAHLMAGALLAEDEGGESSTNEDNRQAMFDIFKPPPKKKVLGIVMRSSNAPDNVGWQARLEGLSHKIIDKTQLADTLSTKYAAGANIDEITRAVKPFVSNIGSSARRIARTEGMRVANDMQDETYKAAGDLITGYRRNEILDGVTGKDHKPLNGKMYGPDAVRPNLPDRPNCRGWWSPILADDTELAKKPLPPQVYKEPVPDLFAKQFDDSTPDTKTKIVGSTLIKRTGKKSPSWNDLVTVSVSDKPAASLIGEPLPARPQRHMQRITGQQTRAVPPRAKPQRNSRQLDLTAAYRRGYILGLQNASKVAGFQEAAATTAVLAPEEQAAFDKGYAAGQSKWAEVEYQRGWKAGSDKSDKKYSLNRSAPWLKGYWAAKTKQGQMLMPYAALAKPVTGPAPAPEIHTSPISGVDASTNQIQILLDKHNAEADPTKRYWIRQKLKALGYDVSGLTKSKGGVKTPAVEKAIDKAIKAQSNETAPASIRRADPTTTILDYARLSVPERQVAQMLLNDRTKHAAQALDKNERAAIASWCKSGYTDMRKVDSGEVPCKKSPSACNKLRLIKRVMDKLPVEHAIVYRGMSLPDEEINKLTKVGHTIEINALSSASIDPTVARNFSKPIASKTPYSTPGTGIILSIKQRSGVNIAPLSGIPDESEVLLPKGAKYRVVGTSMQETVSHPAVHFEKNSAETKEQHAVIQTLNNAPSPGRAWYEHFKHDSVNIEWYSPKEAARLKTITYEQFEKEYVKKYHTVHAEEID